MCMTIIEYAEKLGYKLNSAQMMLLNKMQEAKELICNCLSVVRLGWGK